MSSRPPSHPTISRLLRAGLLALAVVATGCDDSIPTTPGTEETFTLWGYLDPGADQQAVQVAVILDRIDAETPAEIDAEVSVEDLQTGETVAFRDSLVTFADGARSHVFVADWTPDYGASYRFVARRSDGETAEAAVRTPPLVTPEIGPERFIFNDVLYPFTFPGAPNVFGVTLVLYAVDVPDVEGQVRFEIPFPRVRSAEEAIEIRFASAAQDLLGDAGLLDRGVRLDRAELIAFVANEEWDVPSGRFDDTDAIVEPGTISNVEGGFGFVGGGYFTRTAWVPSERAQRLAGFFVDEEDGARGF